MNPRQQKMMRLLPAAVAAAGVVVYLLLPSKAEVKRYVPNADEAPTMSTRDVSTLISDSGYTRYHLTTPLWQMFENAENPYWAFPEGIELEQYDIIMRPESTVECDSAIYFSRQRLWRLDGNVEMTREPKTLFQTQQVFWNEREHTIYSDSFMHIETPTHVLEGMGFVSDQELRSYSINRPTGIFPIDRSDLQPGAPANQNTPMRATACKNTPT